MRDDRFKHLKLKVLPRDYKYVLFDNEEAFWLAAQGVKALPKEELSFLFRCADESSMVVPGSFKVSCSKEEPEWKAIRIVGEMPFGTVQGLIASISTSLQKANIGICAISTYLTDVFFIKTKNLEAAGVALKNEGWEFV